MEVIHRLFKQYLSKNFTEWCKKKGLEPSAEVLIGYMMDADLFKQPVVRRYVIKNDLERAIKCNRNKSKAVQETSYRLGVSESKVWDAANRCNTEFEKG